MIVTLPNGDTAEFPDDMPQEQIEAVLKRTFPPGQEMSTLTGQPAEPMAPAPVDSPEVTPEQVSSRRLRNIAAESLPMGLDAFLTMVAPQAALPAKGLMRLGGKALNLGSRGLFAGAGGMMGEAERQNIKGENDPGAIALSTAIGPAAEVAAPIVGKVAKVAAAGISEASIAGKIVKNYMRKRLTNNVEKFVKDLAPDLEPEQAVLIMGDVISGSKRAASKAYDEYKPFLATIAKNPQYGNGERLYMPDTIDYLENIREEVKARASTPGSANHGWALNRNDTNYNVIQEFGLRIDEGTGKVLHNLITDGTVDPKNIEALHKVYGAKNKFGKLLPSEQEKLKELKEVILGDLDRIVVKASEDAQEKTIGGIIRAADKQYKAITDFFDTNPVAKKIIEPYRKAATKAKVYEAAPELAIKKIFELPPENLKVFKENILKLEDGERVWAGVEYGWVRDMFSRAIKTSGELGDKKLMPFELIKEVDANAAKLDIIDPALRSGIEKQIKHLKEIVVGMRFDSDKLMAGAGSGFISGKAIYSGDYMTAIAYEALGAASAWASLSPKAQKFAATFGKQGGKFAGHELAKPNSGGGWW